MMRRKASAKTMTRVGSALLIALLGWTAVAVAAPIIGITKSVVTYSAPQQGTSNPKAVPGAMMNYTLIVTNAGPDPGEPDGISITDPIPAGTELFVGDISGPGSGPVVFTDGATSSNLTLEYTPLEPDTDDIEFCSEVDCTDGNGLDFNYQPTPDAAGVDAAVTRIRIRPSGTMAASTGAGDPSFQLDFRVRVK